MALICSQELIECIRRARQETDISQETIDDIREACEEKLSDKDYYKAIF